MHDEVLLAVLPPVGWYAVAVGLSYLAVFLFKSRQRAERPTLLRYLLRGPGETVRRQIAAVDARLDLYLLLLIFLPPLLASLMVIRQQVCSASPFSVSAWFWALVGLATVLLVVLLWRILRLLATRKKYSLAFACELAVGQELNLLMRQGCSVFHGFPAEGFVIDHVLAGPSGVYAIVTKGRGKPKKRKNDIEDRVFYDGKVLAFPGWQEERVVGRVKRQAAWLADWLSRVVGEPVAVKGIIFLPGWIVEANGRHEISVVNEKNAPFLGRVRGDACLSEESVQRIAYQIEQRCRNMGGSEG